MIKKANIIYMFILLNLFAVNSVMGQGEYELLFLKHDFNKISELASKKSTENDYYWLSLVYDQQGRTLDAINILKEGIVKYGDVKSLEIPLSKLYYKTGNYTAALPCFEKYVSEPSIFSQYIDILEFQENHVLAINLLGNRLKNDSSNYFILTHLGDNYFQLDSFNLATKYYSKIIEGNPLDQSTAKKLATIYLKEKQYCKAINICDTILKADSTNIKFIRYKARASFNKKDFKTAEACYYKLLQHGDSNRYVYKHLGICSYNNAAYSNCRTYLSEAFKQDTSDYEICFFLGRAWLNSTNQEKALFFFNRIDSLLQPDPEILAALYSEKQSVYSALNKYDKALACYKKAYEYNPKPEILFFIASMYERHLNDNINALKYYYAFIDSLAKTDNPEEQNQPKGLQVISLKNAAESHIIKLKEELFFKEGLNE